MIEVANQEIQFQNNEHVKILIVENELEAKNGLVKMLARRYKNIFTASNGEEGFLLYKQLQPQIIITDIRMAPLDGLEMVKLIRMHDQNTQIIITTAHDENDYFIQAIEYGVNHFILKPIYQDQFLLALQKSIHQVTLEEQIEKQKLFTKTVLDFQENLIFTLNEDKQLLSCNMSFRQFSGLLSSNFRSIQKLDINCLLSTTQFITQDFDFYEWIYTLIKDPAKKHGKVNLMNNEGTEKTFLIKATKIVNEETILVVCTDITELEEEIKKNEFLATRDSLTKAYNRYKFESMLTQEIRRTNRYNTNLSLILFDIDHFKQVNDLHGHSVGDEVLAKIAKLIQQRIRDTDILARWGGEEFIILAPETDLEGAMLLAESLRNLIATYNFPQVGTVTSSFGVQQFNQNSDPKEFIRCADIALYTAKKEGRNKVVFFDITSFQQRGMFNEFSTG